jgi:RimJ/RimL family protein N-acetyltransferase
MRPPARIDVDEITLRAWAAEDLDAMAQAIAESLEHLRPWMPWTAVEPLSREDRARLIVEFARQWEAEESFVYGIFVGETPVGGTGLHPRIGADALEIGYWVHPQWTGRGIATRATRALTVTAFALPGIERVEIHHDQANVASRRIPEKLGFTLVAEVVDPPAAPAEIGIECQWRLTSPADLA